MKSISSRNLTGTGVMGIAFLLTASSNSRSIRNRSVSHCSRISLTPLSKALRPHWVSLTGRDRIDLLRIRNPLDRNVLQLETSE
ncbi:MAG: hypothetical protein IPJ39_04785 [Saprospiraceae bacterium]|nr:hypothetical protein [Saprospiraceae bacterium]